MAPCTEVIKNVHILCALQPQDIYIIYVCVHVSPAKLKMDVCIEALTLASGSPRDPSDTGDPVDNLGGPRPSPLVVAWTFLSSLLVAMFLPSMGEFGKESERLRPTSNEPSITISAPPVYV